MTDQTKKSDSEAADDTKQRPPEFRSVVKPKMHGLAEDFPDMGFNIGKKVWVNGPRGSMGPWEIVEVLGNGTFKLKDGDEVKQRTFREDELSEKPRYKR